MIYNTGNLPEGDRLEVERGENCVIYNLSNAGGTGRITQYDVYDSVNVLYSDLHLTRFGEGSYGEKYLMIEHCREGRFEAEFEGGRRFYMGADKLVVLDGGRVAEQGSPRELEGKPDGIYARMKKLQMNG